MAEWCIVGADGQLGQCLRDALVAQGHSFVALNRDALDITDSSAVHNKIQELRPKFIVNAAAYTNVDGAEDNVDAAHAVNCEGARNVAMAAQEVGATLFHISTDYVFNGNATTPYAHDTPGDPRSVYGQSKWDGELAVINAHPLGSVIVRTAWLYSAYGNNFAKTMVRLSQEDRNVSVVTDQLGQPTSAHDLAGQLIKMSAAGIHSGIFHGTNGGTATWFDFTQAIFQLIGADVARVEPTTADKFPRRAVRPHYSVLGHQQWAATTVAPMRHWQEALAEIIGDVRTAVIGPQQ